MTLQLIGTDALADNAVSTDKSQPFGNIILNSSAAGTDVGDRILLDRTNANGQDAGDAINVEKEILDIEGINVASRKQLKLGAVILESGTTDTVDGDVLLLDSTASGVDEGEMILYNETFNPATFNIGGTLTAGQAIKVDSSGGGFEFGSGGGLVFISGVTLSNVASTAFTGIDSTYETYIFMLNNVVPVSDGVQLYMRTSTDGGSSYDSGSSDYDYRSAAINNSGTFESTGSVDSTFMGLNQGVSSIGSASGEGISLVVHLYQPSNSSLFTTMSYQGTAIYSEGSMRPQFGSGARMATADVDAVQFLFSSGNLESGEINMYGVVKS